VSHFLVDIFSWFFGIIYSEEGKTGARVVLHISLVLMGRLNQTEPSLINCVSIDLKVSIFKDLFVLFVVFPKIVLLFYGVGERLLLKGTG
jgi:hypothetical protein